MKRIAVLLAALTIAFTACSGNGAIAPGPKPTPRPTHTPIQHHKNHFAVANTQLSLSHSSSAHRSTSMKRNDCTVGGPLPTLAVTALNNFAPSPGQETNIVSVGYNVAASELDPSCVTLASAPTFNTAVDNTAISTEVPPIYASLGFTPPTPVDNTVDVWGGDPGTNTMNATFPDGTIAPQPIASYAYFSVGCDGTGAYLGASNWNSLEGMTENPGDINSVCFKSNLHNYDIPGGYEILDAPNGAQSMVDITSAAGFVSQGTSLDPNILTPLNIVVFATADGRFAKIYVGQGCGSCNEMGIVGISDTSGNFPY